MRARLGWRGREDHAAIRSRSPLLSEWRAWLEEHHASAEEAWVLISKKHGGAPLVSLVEATEEALCFGWIDSAMRPIDTERFALRYTPRRTGEQVVAHQPRPGGAVDRGGADDRGRPRGDRGSEAERAMERRGGLDPGDEASNGTRSPRCVSDAPSVW